MTNCYIIFHSRKQVTSTCSPLEGHIISQYNCIMVIGQQASGESAVFNIYTRKKSLQQTFPFLNISVQTTIIHTGVEIQRNKHVVYYACCWSIIRRHAIRFIVVNLAACSCLDNNTLYFTTICKIIVHLLVD